MKIEVLNGLSSLKSNKAGGVRTLVRLIKLIFLYGWRKKLVKIRIPSFKEEEFLIIIEKIVECELWLDKRPTLDDDKPVEEV